MNDFLDWLMPFIKDKFDNDPDFNGAKFTTVYSYIDEKPKTPQFSFMELSDLEDENATTFEGENALINGIQISIYTQQMIINNNLETAQKAALIISKKLRKIIMDLRKPERQNKNILKVRRVGSEFSRPIITGIYYAVNRFEFTLRTKEN